MSTRDDANLSARERAALANLEASAAAEDPQLANRLKGSGRLRLITHLPRIAIRVREGWMGSGWLAGPLIGAGLVLVVLGLSTMWVLGVAGAAMSALGLWIVAGLIEQRIRRGGGSPG